MRSNAYAWLDSAALIGSAVLIVVLTAFTWVALSRRVVRATLTPEKAFAIFLFANAGGWPTIFCAFVYCAASIINSVGNTSRETLYRGSKWNGDAALGVFLVAGVLFAAGAFASIVFAIHVARIRLRRAGVAAENGAGNGRHAKSTSDN